MNFVGVTCKLSHLGTAAACCSVFSWHIPFCCALPFWATGCCCCQSSPCRALFVLFCPPQLPTGLYKKVLVILHDSVLPYMNEPTLMMDFLTVAYGIGEWPQPFILCGTSSMGQMDLQALLDAAPRAGWWSSCAFGWDGAKELGATASSLQEWDDFTCVCHCPCSLCIRKITFKALGKSRILEWFILNIEFSQCCWSKYRMYRFLQKCPFWADLCLPSVALLRN